MKQATKILRWMLVLPAALAGAWAVQLASSLGNAFAGFGPDDWRVQAWSIVVRPGFSAFAFVWCGGAVAPTHRKPTAFALGALVLVLAGAFLARSLSFSDWPLVISSMSLAIGAGLTLWAVHTGEILPDASSIAQE